MCAGSLGFAAGIVATFTLLPVDRPSKGMKETRSIGAPLKTFPSLLAYVTLTLIFTMTSALACGQSAEAPSQPNVTPGVPRLVRFRGQLKDASGNWLTNTVGVVFAIYSEQTGGVPLWQETQNVQFSHGSYTVFLGNSTSGGVPAELFASGESQWLGVKALLLGEEEQPRVLLASVPYALKAVDADTLGGLPSSSYLRSDTLNCGSVVAPALAATGSITTGSINRGAQSPVAVVTASAGAPASATRTRTNGEESGQVSLTDSTSASYAFPTRWASPPVCTLTPTSDPHSIGGYWVTSSTSAITANAHYPGRITFNFRCQAATSF
jgi:hypothetical protein